MHIRDFDAGAIPRDSRQILHVDVARGAGESLVRHTLLVVAGQQAGPLLVVSGGVHGNEYEGPLAVRLLFEGLQPAELRGTFVGLPVANPLAFEGLQRGTPADGLNLARVFPGRADGSVTEQIAYWMGERLIGRADFYIDFHSGGPGSELPQLCGYTLGEGPAAELQRRVAEAFHADTIWAHPQIAPGRTISYAWEHGVPAIYTECASNGGVTVEHAEAYARGGRNAMRVLGMLAGDLEGQPSTHYIVGAGDFDAAMRVSVGGYWLPERGVLDEVQAGDLIGCVRDLAGRVLEEVRAPAAGYVVLRRIRPAVAAGDTVSMLAQAFQR